MHIALVIEQFDAPHGGAERSSSQIVDALVERGHTLTVLAGRKGEGAEREGVAVRTAPTGPPKRGRTIPPFVRWVEGELASGGFDVSLAVVTWLPADVLEPRSGIVVESQERLIARRRSAWGRLAKRIEFAVTPKYRLMRALEERQLRGDRVQRVVAISRYMREQLVRHYGFDAASVPLIPNGAEMPEPDPAWRGEVRARYGIAEQAPLFLFVANDPWRKGVQPLLRALRALPDVARLLVAGNIRPPVKRLVAELGLEEQVVFAGPVPDPAPLYCAADVSVLPSYYDPASKVVIESLMMGTPAITTAYNGSRDVIDGGDHPLRGRVVEDPDDVAGLARAMEELSDPSERARCVAGLGDLREELSMRTHAARLEAVLSEVAARLRG